MENLKVEEFENPKTPKEEFVSFAEISVSAYANEEPIAYRIVRSGWSKPQMYHVLVEFGDYGDTTYKGLMSAEQIKSELGLIMIDHESIKSYSTKHPNDMDLGKTIRNIKRHYDQKFEI